jgi:hypothetical protein
VALNKVVLVYPVVLFASFLNLLCCACPTLRGCEGGKGPLLEQWVAVRRGCRTGADIIVVLAQSVVMLAA